MIVLEGKTVEFKVCGIDLISTKVHGIKLDGMLFKNLFKSLHKKEVPQSNGEIEALIVYEYAGYHPVKQQSVGHLLLLKNRFGKCIGGSHPNLQEGTSKLIQYATVNRARRKFNLIEKGLEWKGDHWFALYPWIKDPGSLPNNYNLAEKCFAVLKREDVEWTDSRYGR